MYLKKILLIGFLLLLGISYGQNQTEVIPPEIYDSREFEILNKMSVFGEKSRYLQAIRTLKTPAVRLVKYYPDFKVKGPFRRDYRIYQKELWLYVISKHFKGRIIVFIDSEIDGFVYENKDNEIDAVGILNKDGFRLLKFRGEDDDNGFLIFKMDNQFYTIKTSIYLKFFELAKKKSDKTWIGFNEEGDKSNQPKSLDFEDFVFPGIPGEDGGFDISDEIALPGEIKATPLEQKKAQTPAPQPTADPTQSGDNKETPKSATTNSPQKEKKEQAPEEYKVPDLDFDF